MIFYKPEDPGAGSFWHTKPGVKPEEIKPGDAQDYDYPFFEQRPVVLKIHGTAHKDDQYSRYVITEDHYIQYVADRPLQNLLPRRVLTKLKRNHILYLGYSLADWNLRVFLYMVGQQPRDRFKGWAIKKYVEEDDALAWQKRKVDVFDMDLTEYVREMKQALGMD